MTFQDKLKIKYADDIEIARELGNMYDVDVYGRFPWDRSEHRGKHTTLSKASIGEFCYAVLSCGGEVSSIWPFTPHSRSAVFYRVRLTIAQKQKIEDETKYRFDPPPVVTFNSG